MGGRREWTGETVRNVELSRVFMGGFDEASTRELLGSLADSLDAAAAARREAESERDSLARRVEELEAAQRAHAAAAPSEPYAEKALTKMIRSASDAVEDVLREAKDEAAHVRAEAAAEAARLVEDSRAELRRAQSDVAELRRLLIATTSRLFDSVEAARAMLESLEQGLPDTPAERELVQDLLDSRREAAGMRSNLDEEHERVEARSHAAPDADVDQLNPS